MRAVLAALLLIAAVAFTYRDSFDGGFVSDDRSAILNNPLLRSLDAENIRAIFSSFDDANYIPVKVLSLAIDQRLWGPEPFGYHLGNLLLHILCTLLVWRILLYCRFSPATALIVALLWGLHPLQVESVAFMSERKNVLSGAFFFAAFLAYLHFSASGRWHTYAAVLVLFVLALLSKMNTVVLPALCLAYDALIAGRLGRRSVLASLPLFAAGAVVVWYNLAGNRIHGNAFHGGSPVVTWLTSATVPYRYLAAVVWPAHLRNFYYIPLHGSPLDAPVALAIVGLLALAVAIAWLAARRRPEAFWLLWFPVTLAPMLNIVPFPTLMQDRYMYLPLLGLLAAPAFTLDGALRMPLARRLAAAIAVALIVLAALRSEQRIAVWHDELSLWRDWAMQEWYLPVDVGPLRTQDSERHLAVLEEAARLDPTDVVVRQNLGALLYERGDLTRATVELEAAASLPGGDAAMPLLNLGRTYLHSGKPDRARDVLRRSAASEPYAFYSQLNLARAALALGDVDTAAPALAAAARIRPGRDSQYAAEQAKLERLRQTSP